MLMVKHILNYFKSIWQWGLTLVEEQLRINGRLFCMYFSWKKNNLKKDKKRIIDMYYTNINKENDF